MSIDILKTDYTKGIKMAKFCGNCRFYVREKFLGSYCYVKRRNHEKYDLVSKNQSACYNYQAAVGAGDGGDPEHTGDCFLTSACAEYMSKADDCAELTVLRAFRDGYLKKTADGERLIKEYYEIAPKIVESINNSGEKERYFAYIYGVITKCVALLSEGNDEQTLAEYKAMVEKLKSEVL